MINKRTSPLRGVQVPATGTETVTNPMQRVHRKTSQQGHDTMLEDCWCQGRWGYNTNTGWAREDCVTGEAPFKEGRPNTASRMRDLAPALAMSSGRGGHLASGEAGDRPHLAVPGPELWLLLLPREGPGATPPPQGSSPSPCPPEGQGQQRLPPLRGLPAHSRHSCQLLLPPLGTGQACQVSAGSPGGYFWFPEKGYCCWLICRLYFWMGAGKRLFW